MVATPSTTHNLLSVQLSPKYKRRMRTLCAQHDTVAELRHHNTVTCVHINQHNIELTLSKGRAGCNKGHITTSSLSLSCCAGAAHTCTGTCSLGPCGGYRTCVCIKKCCKCKSTRTYSCTSVSGFTLQRIDSLLSVVVRIGLGLRLRGYMGSRRLERVGGHSNWKKHRSRRPCVPQRYFLDTCPPKCTVYVLQLPLSLKSGCLTLAVSGAPWWGEIN